MSAKLSICEFTTIGASFAEDVEAYAAAGVGGIGICEFKLSGDDDGDRKLLREAGLVPTACVPAVPSILPLPLMEGPPDPAERVEALCASVRRLAAFEPGCVLFLTGPGDDTTAIREGIRAVAAAGREAGVRVALEPVQREFAHFWTVVSSLDEAARLADEAGEPDLGLLFDTWHLGTEPDLPEQVARHGSRVAGAHVADRREPTRNTNDRVFPGDGVLDLAPMVRALADAGYEGPWDVEIFSDADLPDSLWRLDARDAARMARERLETTLLRAGLA